MPGSSKNPDSYDPQLRYLIDTLGNPDDRSIPEQHVLEFTDNKAAQRNRFRFYDLMRAIDRNGTDDERRNLKGFRRAYMLQARGNKLLITPRADETPEPIRALADKLREQKWAREPAADEANAAQPSYGPDEGDRMIRELYGLDRAPKEADGNDDDTSNSPQ